MSVSMRAVIDATDLTRRPKSTASPLWWAIWGLIAIEITVVGIFTASAFYLRMGQPEWPPAGVEPPPLLWPTVNLGIMLGSIVAMAWAGRGVRRDDRRALVGGLFLAVSGAVLVLVFRWLQFRTFAFGPDEHAYGSLVWTLTGFHFVHVTAAVLGTGAIGVAAAMGYYHRDRTIGVDVDAMYWYFVALAWIPLYGVLYWMPRILGSGP